MDHADSALCLRRSPSSAFTMIELVITIAVIGIVLASLFASFHESLKFMGGQKDIRRAALLCEDLMNEIRVKEFDDSASGGVFVRADCVGVEDYHLWSESPPETIEGAVMSNFAGFTRSVVVERINTNGFDFDGAFVTTNDTDFRRVTVIVSTTQFSVSNISVVGRFDY